MSTIHPGLCATCRHVRRAGNRRGSIFHRCALSEVDARFPKYPRLPVLRCIGWERDGWEGDEPGGPTADERGTE